MPIEIGVLLTTWEELRGEEENWSIEEHFQFKLTYKDQTWADYQCKHRNSGCSWRLYVFLEQQGNIKVKKVDKNTNVLGPTKQIARYPILSHGYEVLFLYNFWSLRVPNRKRLLTV